MTLVAATRLEGIPVLFGDLLLIAPAWTGSDSFHPVQPIAAGRLPQETGKRVAGACRKTILINDHLAPGWAGSHFSAGRVLKSLLSKFGVRPIDYGILQSFLSTQTCYQEDRYAIQLVGWLFDFDHHCFRWNSQWPQELFEASQHFDGTGEELFKSILFNVGTRGAGPGLKNSTDLVPYVAVSEMAKCIAEDVASGKLTTNYFGNGFETIFWDGSRYRYVEEVTYLIRWRILTTSDNANFHTEYPQLVIKYKSAKDYCILQTVHLSGRLRDNIFVQAIGMPGDTRDDPHVREQIPFSVKSPLYGSYVEMSVPGFLQLSGPVVTADGDQELFWIEEPEPNKLKLYANVQNVYHLFTSNKWSTC